MSRRKDPKGRVLREGESFRKSDKLYTFRYKNQAGKVKAIYDTDLKELRRREEEILSVINEGVDYSAGKLSVIGLVERYISLKEGVRYNTKIGYNFVLNILKKEEFGSLQIGSIKPSDAQKWFIKLHKDGKGYSTLTSVRGVLKPAFQMAFEEDIIRRNPFNFIITNYVPNDSKHREALTDLEQKIWMDFIKKDKTYNKYYDEFVILLGTGMRVSEFCGLTMSDLDFTNRSINVDHELVRVRGGKYCTEKTKTEWGRRSIPMPNDVFNSFKNIINKFQLLKKECL